MGSLTKRYLTVATAFHMVGIFPLNFIVVPVLIWTMNRLFKNLLDKISQQERKEYAN